jgi:hypothetical protein
MEPIAQPYSGTMPPLNLLRDVKSRRRSFNKNTSNKNTPLMCQFSTCELSSAARLRSNKSRLLRVALQQIDSIPGRTKVIAHHLSGELDARRYLCLPEAHLDAELRDENEKTRTNTWQENTDKIASLICIRPIEH